MRVCYREWIVDRLLITIVLFLGNVDQMRIILGMFDLDHGSMCWNLVSLYEKALVVERCVGFKDYRICIARRLISLSLLRESYLVVMAMLPMD